MEISLDGISFRYGRRKQVLTDVTWQIYPGVTGLLGENGAGKTTLMSILVGLRNPSSGEVTLGTGEQPTLGFVPQRVELPGEMRADDAISYAAWINGVDRHDSDEAARRALAAVDLEEHSAQRLRKLSGGQRQRLAIAQALAHDPDVLVLDEPTVGLDVRQRKRVLEVIAELGATRSVLISTHMLSDVEALCDRVGVLADARISFDGTVDELKHAGVAPSEPTARGLADIVETDLERGYRSLLEGSGGDQ